MNTTEEITKAAGSFTPGTRIKVLGYENSRGEVKPEMNVELLSSDGYYGLHKQDLVILRAFSVEGAIEESSPEDLQAALRQLIESRERVDADSSNKAFASYEMLDSGSESSLRTLSKSPESVYLLRMLCLDDYETPPPAKGAIPRAKQVLTRWLELPSRKYVHTLKFTDGKFGSIDIVSG